MDGLDIRHGQVELAIKAVQADSIQFQVNIWLYMDGLDISPGQVELAIKAVQADNI